MTTPCLAVAVSGGVDSLYALVSLHRAGHRVMAVHGRFLPPADEAADPVPLLDAVCREFGIPFHCLDYRERFDTAVVAPFLQQYAAGRTPNPCALCNARIKFGALLDAARERGATALATGHYARLERHGNSVRLYQGADTRKDQSYFLALVPAARLAAASFPLAHIHKTDAVQRLAAWGVPVPLPAESQEICFVPQDAYRPFVEGQCAARGIRLGGAGRALLHAGTPAETVVGRHKGLWQYTEGQRRGLGIAYSEPLYVAGKDVARNALLLCVRRDLAMRGCRVEGLNILVPREQWPADIYARVRYKQSPCPVELRWEGEDAVCLAFPHGQNPTAPGQVAALYSADGCVLAGGSIVSTE